MPRNASGVYTLPTGNPVVTGTLITSTWANATMPDIGTELTSSLDRSGRGGMLAPFKATDGLVGAPGIAFSNEPTSGIWRSSAGVMPVSILGSNIGSFQSTGWNGATVGTHTGGVTGHASLDLALTGGVMSGPIEMTSTTQVTVSGSTGSLQLGYLRAAITSTTDAFVAWADATQPLNGSGINGSLLLAPRNIAGGAIHFAARNGLRATIDTNGLGIGGTTLATSTEALVLGLAGNVPRLGLLKNGVLQWSIGGDTAGGNSLDTYANAGLILRVTNGSTYLQVGSTSAASIGSGVDLLAVGGTIGVGNGGATAQINGSATFFEFPNRLAGGGIKFYVNAAATVALTMASNGTLTDSQGVELGWKSMPRTSFNGSRTDCGRMIALAAGVTIANAVYLAGDTFSLINEGAAAITITQGASLTMTLAGTTTTGSRTLAKNGIMTLWFDASNLCYVSGPGVT